MRSFRHVIMSSRVDRCLVESTLELAGLGGGGGCENRPQPCLYRIPIPSLRIGGPIWGQAICMIAVSSPRPSFSFEDGCDGEFNTPHRTACRRCLGINLVVRLSRKADTSFQICVQARNYPVRKRVRPALPHGRKLLPPKSVSTRVMRPRSHPNLTCAMLGILHRNRACEYLSFR